MKNNNSCTRENVFLAFKQYEEGKRPDNYGEPKSWFVHHETKFYPVKIIWALASGLNNTSDISTTNAVKFLTMLDFTCVQIEHLNSLNALNDFNAVNKALNATPEERLKKLKNANKKPSFSFQMVKVFNRNPYVVAEVLSRANGICESCGNPAPFISKSNSKPYLEVHHIKPLSEGGYDSVDNCIALCPNCHREKHFG